MDFQQFDRRSYVTVSPSTGYAEWAATYDDTVPDQLDIRVFESISSVEWAKSMACLDLACGTGRTCAWLRQQGVATIDGLDITPEMLDLARAKNLYRSCFRGSVEQSGITGAHYDLLVMSLADEHLADLDRVYLEAHRLGTQGAKFVVVGMHPAFFMTGMPTHFKDRQGNPKAIETHVHLVSDHVRSAIAAGWNLAEMHEGVIDEEWVRVKPQWARYKNVPVNFGYVWERQI